MHEFFLNWGIIIIHSSWIHHDKFIHAWNLISALPELFLKSKKNLKHLIDIDVIYSRPIIR